MSSSRTHRMENPHDLWMGNAVLRGGVRQKPCPAVLKILAVILIFWNSGFLWAESLHRTVLVQLTDWETGRPIQGAYVATTNNWTPDTNTMRDSSRTDAKGQARIAVAYSPAAGGYKRLELFINTNDRVYRSKYSTFRTIQRSILERHPQEVSDRPDYFLSATKYRTTEAEESRSRDTAHQKSRQERLEDAFQKILGDNPSYWPPEYLGIPGSELPTEIDWYIINKRLIRGYTSGIYDKAAEKNIQHAIQACFSSEVDFEGEIIFLDHESAMVEIRYGYLDFYVVVTASQGQWKVIRRYLTQLV